jgi:hypothetical protein
VDATQVVGAGHRRGFSRRKLKPEHEALSRSLQSKEMATEEKEPPPRYESEDLPPKYEPSDSPPPGYVLGSKPKASSEFVFFLRGLTLERYIPEFEERGVLTIPHFMALDGLTLSTMGILSHHVKVMCISMGRLRREGYK